MGTTKANLRYRLTVFIVLAGLLTIMPTSYSPPSLATSEARKQSPPSDKVGVVATSQSKSSFPDRLMPVGANVQLTPGGGAIHSMNDSAGVARFALLLFVSPTQINYIMPAGTSDGSATVDVIPEGGGSVIASGGAQVTTVAPGIFTVSGTGSPPTAAGQWLRYSGGVLVDSGSLETPIAFGDPGDKVYLVLYGTDIRKHSSLSAVSATVGGSSAVVEYAGPQGALVGLDQINIQIPPGLSDTGQLNVVVTVDGIASNTVKVTAGN